jgi:hypothetical protein
VSEVGYTSVIMSSNESTKGVVFGTSDRAETVSAPRQQFKQMLLFKQKGATQKLYI